MAVSLMTDPVIDCAKEASITFADLARVAPLVREVAQVSWSLNMDDHSKSVMDHLIHGKPLPPCEIPSYITGEMQKTGLKLRGYQAGGVAWLRFLQTVKLNGALCDDMGLGKIRRGACLTSNVGKLIMPHSNGSFLHYSRQNYSGARRD
jgi:hypothetical protein